MRNFEIISIVSLGSGTFMATGTNTVVLFMRKRNKFLAKNLEANIHKFFDNLVDISLNNIENVFSKYVKFVWWVNFDDYKTLCQKNPNNAIQNSELFRDFVNKSKWQKIQALCDSIIEIEKEKILYFVLSYNQNMVLVKSWDKQIEKEFLWYEFSTRKGSEWIHPIQWWKSIDECTKLFDPQKINNDNKISTYIYDWFDGKFDREISEEINQYISRTKLVDLITFDRVDFEKNISTNIKRKIKIETKWNMIKIEAALDKINQDIVKVPKKDVLLSGKYPVISQEKDVIIWFSDFENPITNLPIIIFGDHNKVLKYIDSPFFVWADGVKLLKPKQEFIAKYFYYILDSIKFDWAQSYQRHYSILKDIEIPLPPLNIQQQIVDEISVLEKKEKENKEKVNSMKDEIGDIIWWIDWDKYTLWDVCDVRDWTHDSPKFYWEGFPLITWKNLVNWKIDFWDIKLISKEDYDQINQRSLVERWDVLFWMIWTIWNPVLVEEEANFAIKNVALFKFSNNNVLLNSYFRYLLDSKIIIDQLETWTKWKTQKFVWLNILRGLKIPIPKIEIQRQIVSQIEKIEQEIEKLESELKEIPKQKEEILKKYL